MKTFQVIGFEKKVEYTFSIEDDLVDKHVKSLNHL